MKRGATAVDNYDQRQTKRLKQDDSLIQVQQALAKINHNPNQAGSALFEHAQDGNALIVQAILTGFNRQITDGYKGWSLYSAARQGHDKVVNVLLQYAGADIQPQQLAHAYHQGKVSEETKQRLGLYLKQNHGY